MEISFKRVSDLNSSKPPINKRSVAVISTSGPLTAAESKERMQNFFRENKVQPRNNNLKRANTLDNDVFMIRGENAHSAKITKQSCDKLELSDNKKHILTQINLQPKKAKKQAAFFIDATAMQGKQVITEVDKSKKGRVRIKIRPLDVMA